MILKHINETSCTLFGVIFYELKPYGITECIVPNVYAHVSRVCVFGHH